MQSLLDVWVGIASHKDARPRQNIAAKFNKQTRSPSSELESRDRTRPVIANLASALVGCLPASKPMLHTRRSISLIEAIGVNPTRMKWYDYGESHSSSNMLAVTILLAPHVCLSASNNRQDRTNSIKNVTNVLGVSLRLSASLFRLVNPDILAQKGKETHRNRQVKPRGPRSGHGDRGPTGAPQHANPRRGTGVLRSIRLHILRPYSTTLILLLCSAQTLFFNLCFHSQGESSPKTH